MLDALTPTLCQALAPYLGQPLTPEAAARVVAAVGGAVYPGPLDTSCIAPERVGSYEIAFAPAIEVLPQLRPLHERHWNETEGYRHGLPFSPDYERGIDLEAQGRYVLIVARHIGTEKVVGNYGIFLSRSTHTQTLMATEDTLFIVPEHRRGRLGVGMIRFAERALAALGVRELNVSVKLVNKTGPMLERMGYAPVATQYSKILKEEANVLA